MSIFSNATVSLVLGAFAGTAGAATINLDAINSGWYDSSGQENGKLNNIDQISGSYRDWLGFDLTSISGTITNAVLEVGSDPSNGSGQTITWWDVTTPYANLGSVASFGIFADLGSGVVFASGIHTNGVVNSFTLNAAGLASLNAATSFWAVGGDNNTGSPAFGYTSGVGSGDHIRLVLTTGSTVPDTGATASLLALGLGAVALSRRRRVA